MEVTLLRMCGQNERNSRLRITAILTNSYRAMLQRAIGSFELLIGREELFWNNEADRYICSMTSPILFPFDGFSQLVTY